MVIGVIAWAGLAYALVRFMQNSDPVDASFTRFHWLADRLFTAGLIATCGCVVALLAGRTASGWFGLRTNAAILLLGFIVVFGPAFPRYVFVGLLIACGLGAVAIAVRILVMGVRMNAIPARGALYTRADQPWMFWLGAMTSLALFLPIGLVLLGFGSYVLWLSALG